MHVSNELQITLKLLQVGRSCLAVDANVNFVNVFKYIIYVRLEYNALHLISIQQTCSMTAAVGPSKVPVHTGALGFSL